MVNNTSAVAACELCIATPFLSANAGKSLPSGQIQGEVSSFGALIFSIAAFLLVTSVQVLQRFGLTGEFHPVR